MRSIDVRHPRKNDVLGRQFTIAGIGTAFEGTVEWRLQVNGRTVQQGSMHGGSMGVIGEFVERIDLEVGGEPTAATLQVYGDNPGKPTDGASPGTGANTIPVALVADAIGFVEYDVKPGDTLSRIAAGGTGYGESSVDAIVVANPDLIKDPDLIQIGWQLRVPILVDARKSSA